MGTVLPNEVKATRDGCFDRFDLRYSTEKGAAMIDLVEILVEALVGRRTGWEIKERLGIDQVVVLELYASKGRS